MINTTQRRSIYLIFTLSGFTALVYEILWAKQLSLVFGTSMIAVSIVAATFMAGLALGSRLLGRFIDRHRDCLRNYAILELGIALSALTFPLGLKLIRSGYIDLSHIWADTPLYSHSLQFVQTTVLLLLPAMLMGGTFPVICRQFARRKCGGQIGRLYAFNTLGATLGAFCCGFVLIPNIGISNTNYLAVSLNLLVVVIAWIIGGRLGKTASEPHDTLRLTPDRSQRLILHSIALIGFLALAYEILWTRVLLLFIGNTSYAFSLILSCFLVGIAAGGWLYARLARPEMDEKGIYLSFIAAMGCFILLTSPFYDRLAYLFQYIHEFSGERWWLLSLHNWLAAFAIMGPPAILSGALLPASVALINPGQNRTGSGVGLVVSHNTLGAVFGSLTAGFIMVPAMGLQNSFLILGLLNLALAGLLLLWFYRNIGRRWPAKLILTCGILASINSSPWNAALMNSGVYCYAAKYSAMGGIDKVIARERILETIEGRDTTVTVQESLDGRFRFFTVNGKTDGGTGSDTTTQTLIGHLPMLLHPAPKNALVIGLGTGITLEGLSSYVNGGVDCVEISPEVVAAEKYFSEANSHALNDPKVRLLINDGRNHLLARKQQYDVIVSEPSNPWQSGNANLFTHEFYQLVKQRLTPQGIFSQWIGLYDITPENLKVACRTLLAVFPHVLAFHSGSDMILLATNQEQHFDYNRLTQRFKQPLPRSILTAIGINTPGDLIARHYLYGTQNLKRFATGVQLNRDNHPILEYSAHNNLGRSTLGTLQERNVRELYSARQREMLPLQLGTGSPQQHITALRNIAHAFKRTGAQPEADFFMQRAETIAADL